MFGTHELWLFVLSAFLLNVPPGPDTLYSVGRSSTLGWHAGAVAALGIGTGAVVHICTAALGLSALLAASATAFTIVVHGAHQQPTGRGRGFQEMVQSLCRQRFCTHRHPAGTVS